MRKFMTCDHDSSLAVREELDRDTDIHPDKTKGLGEADEIVTLSPAVGRTGEGGSGRRPPSSETHVGDYNQGCGGEGQAEEGRAAKPFLAGRLRSLRRSRKASRRIAARRWLRHSGGAGAVGREFHRRKFGAGCRC